RAVLALYPCRVLVNEFCHCSFFPPLIRRINFLCFAQRFLWLLKSWHAVYLYACPLQLHRRAASAIVWPLKELAAMVFLFLLDQAVVHPFSPHTLFLFEPIA